MAVLLNLLNRRELAEEALHDVFVRVWDRAGSFDPARGSAMGWLVAIARNIAFDHHRRHRRELANLGEPIEELSDPRSDAGLALDRRALIDCLARLEAEPRRCVLLAHQGGYSYESCRPCSSAHRAPSRAGCAAACSGYAHVWRPSDGRGRSAGGAGGRICARRARCRGANCVRAAHGPRAGARSAGAGLAGTTSPFGRRIGADHAEPRGLAPERPNHPDSAVPAANGVVEPARPMVRLGGGRDGVRLRAFGPTRG
ncbi:MAG: RNA polymerase sigma factor [Geminicoccaceae bacterium]